VARPRPRIESLSDLIFGLALSVGSLALVSSLPTSTPDLLGDIGTFAFTFLILISVWFDYTRIMSVMPVNEQRTVLLNTLLLFTVSLEPFLFIVLKSPNTSGSFWQVVSQAYAIDLGTMMAVLASFTASLSVDQSVRLHPKIRARFRQESISRYATAAVFFVSVIPFFGEVYVFDEPLRIVIWFVPLAYAVSQRWRRGGAYAVEATPGT
jgi:uncharacterized membrane protein